MTSEFIRFLIVGSSAAIVNFIARIILNNFYSFRISIVIAYLIGMIVAYLLSKFLVFSPSGKHPILEFAIFSGVNALAIIQVWFISVLLAEYIFPSLEFNYYSNEIAHFFGISVPVVSSYFGHKYFSFKQSK